MSETTCTKERPCEACQRIIDAAPRGPAAGATPAREETLAAAMKALTLIDETGYSGGCDLTRVQARALLAALRERDAAREDAARRDYERRAVLDLLDLLDEWAWTNHAVEGRTPQGVGAGVGLEAMIEHRDRLRVIFAARAAAEGRTPVAHVCGARGFGLHVDDHCAACEATRSTGGTP